MSGGKKIMFINRRGPYGSIYAQESLEIAMIGGAFDQPISLALIDDGVFLLRAGQDTDAGGMKHFTAAYRALGDFDIERVYIERQSLEARGMTTDDLLSIPADAASGQGSLLEVVDSAELSRIIHEQDVLLNH
ncbi:MAG TPA: DsrE family protein [Arenicellales bacterium]|nr:DsrE family protein [Arenicellales bacterium]